LDVLALELLGALQFGELAAERFVAAGLTAQAHEGAHDFHVDQDGAAAAEHAREHRHSLLRECIG
jgi:hypothetical protein